jgi:GNAT superfamily N-acetyltransferase
LYERMVERYAKSLGYDVVVDDRRGHTMFVLDKDQSIREESFNGIDIDMDIEGDEIMVTAMANGRELGHVLFVDEGEYLMPQDLEVDERFQGQGIAAAMYDYVKSKGYKIRRSGQQTDAGAGFWDKHRPEQNIWEGQIVETQFAVNRNPAKGLWQLRMPKAGAPLVDETEFVVLKDARPWQAPEGEEKLKITNFVVGDETDEKPQGEGRQIGYVRGGDDPFVYMDTMQPYRGSRYVVFNDRKFLAFDSLEENFADGKVKGKSRPGRVKRAGASCNGSVTDLRARAKKASGEKAKMYHWCANMKSGRKK